ncbi:MAG: hypothetical protein GEU94_02025 [Micromonosporaceae bacterium]|nr:hypothetical protein [Micromonosporaceae bacterium]
MALIPRSATTGPPSAPASLPPTDDVLGAVISHSPAWHAVRDTVLFETYGLRLVEESAAPSAHGHRTAARALVRTRGYPSWWSDSPAITGRALEAVGLQGPMLYPEQALLFRLVATDSDTEWR